MVPLPKEPTNGFKTRRIIRSAFLAIIVTVVRTSPPPSAEPHRMPLKIFILAGQSDMDGQAGVSKIYFFREAPDPARADQLERVRKVFRSNARSF